MTMNKGIDYFKALELSKGMDELCSFDLLPDMREVWMFVNDENVLVIEFFDENQEDGCCWEVPLEKASVEKLFEKFFSFANGGLNYEAVKDLKLKETKITNNLLQEIEYGFREMCSNTELKSLVVNGKTAEVVKYWDTYVTLWFEDEEVFRDYTYKEYYDMCE